jgi:hypothetical protein
MMKIEWVTGTPYMLINEGDRLVINYEKWMELSKDERKFVLEHERLHEMMRRGEIVDGTLVIGSRGKGER